ncbi:hypothetical protein CYMTET_48524 [Cymbomonas tetramitiformis]|uniref:Uncharacterized protein n=3 Tax=Cymbomonas tetramitiformis TaxID=36881 RepID=A0AAE0BTC8_9CHLO|nr:hypothetical protein CYMTET_48524 [Cymbomonas tetramitiformis]
MSRRLSFTHDPGAPGDSGEGEAAMVSICLVIIVTTVRVVRNQYIRLTAPETTPNLERIKVAEIAAVKDGKEGAVEMADSKVTAALPDQGNGAGTGTDFDDEDMKAMEAWTQPEPYDPSPEFREKFIKYLSCGSVEGDVSKPEEGSSAFKALYYLSGINWPKIGLVCLVVYFIWIFLVCLGIMGTGFKLLGGKDSAKMFDVVDNPISGLMIGILVTVLVQSSSTSTSIIIGLVGADEMSVSTAIPMIMGANIGTSVTNTLVAIGHFASPAELRRGFAGATVHDCFNLLNVAVLLPIQWATNFLGHLSYEMAKGEEACDEDVDDCEATEFIKPYLKPYISGVASYDKKVAKYVAEGYCDGQCGDSASSDERKAVTEYVCKKDEDDKLDCDDVDGFKKSWLDDDVLKKKRLPAYVRFVEPGYAEYFYECPIVEGCDSDVGLTAELWNRTSDSLTAAAAAAAASGDGSVFEVCHKMKSGLCDGDLLKGGLMLDDWNLDDESAGALAVFFSLAGICCVLYLIVQTLSIVIKGFAARYLRIAVTYNGYISMVIGCFVTIMVQSSSITTSVLTPLVAVGLISLEDMFPLTLGANIGTTITGIMAASVVTSNPVEAWQVAICHLFFNIIGICIWFPVPFLRKIPIEMAKKLGVATGKHGVWFPIVYVAIVFFAVPGVCYGIAVAATS